MSPCILLYYFWMEQWQPCNATCGGGTRVRTLDCILRSDLRPSTSNSDCQDYQGNPIPASALPPQSGLCNVPLCPLSLPMWSLGAWSTCSSPPTLGSNGDVSGYPVGSIATCGGLQSRSVVCMDPMGTVLPDAACVASGLPRPADTQRCGRCSMCRPYFDAGDSLGAMTCSGHGACADDGLSCTCDSGWGGATCNTPASCAVGSTSGWGWEPTQGCMCCCAAGAYDETCSLAPPRRWRSGGRLGRGCDVPCLMVMATVPLLFPCRLA